MEKYTSNYVNANKNFVIQNIDNIEEKRDKYYSVLCIIQNILTRSDKLIQMSEFLDERVGISKDTDRLNNPLCLISKDNNKWTSRIKGDDTNKKYPAKIFLEECIPEYLGEYKFIQNLILPETRFEEIIENYENTENKQVDFYLPQAKVVIEIDGIQHKEGSNKINDIERDNILKTGDPNIRIYRINTEDIYSRSEKLSQTMKKLKLDLEKRTIINMYKSSYEKGNSYSKYEKENYLKPTSIMRYQILLISMLKKNIISLNDKVWQLNVFENEDIEDSLELAIDDLFIWLNHLCKLSKIKFKKPQLRINRLKNKEELRAVNGIKINFSVLKRWNDGNELDKSILFVRNDYFDKNNYFEVSTAEPIKYEIINDGEDSDIPSLKFILKNVFGFDEFNDGQLPIIINALEGKDTIGLLPTGSGKSLCYQFVGILQPCINFVVCPIKSLMIDQKENLDDAHINNTNYINSDQTGEEKDKILKEFAQGKYLFIWISPERFQIKEFRNSLLDIEKEKKIGLAVIDEVHCLSEWGHDFRTSYLNLIETIRRYCNNPVMMGLTATASSFVLEDLKIEFGLKSENIKTLSSFTRPELKFIVKKDENNDDSIYGNENNLYNIIKKYKEEGMFEDTDKAGIIFTPHVNGKKGCYYISNELNRRFFGNKKPEMVRYYSGKPPKEFKKSDKEFDDEKIKNQKLFKKNEFPIMVATKAFGMGVNKSNIRYTIHYGMPSSLESLYQEAGRAGRDKKDAECYILYSKEQINRETLNLIFNPESSVKEITSVRESYGYNTKDIMNNMFFWINQTNDVEEDLQSMKKIYSKAKPGSKILLKSNDSEVKETEKIIYKMVQVGVVKDWIIESWSKNRIYNVEFENFTSDSIENSVLKYIRRYDKEFSFLSNNEKYKKYNKIYNNESEEKIFRLFRILLEWSYENISYNKRQSLKNIMELCDNYKDDESFKRELERYFKFTDGTLLLDEISQNPKKYEYWFENFYNKEDDSIISIESIEELKGSMSRLLESYRYNTGLNFMSGIIRLSLEEFDNYDGRDRLNSAFQDIAKYDKNEIKYILEEVFKLKDLFKTKSQREEISKIICDNIPNEKYNIYKELEDNYSLSKIIEECNERINKILN